jgi:hypothetical protein
MTVEQDGFAFEVNFAGQARLKKYKGGEKSVVIPSDVDGHPVAAICDWAFAKLFGTVALSHVVVPEGVTHIGAYAFNNCTRLAHIFLPSTLTHLSASAFSGCTALESITIPQGVTVVPDRLLNDCQSLTQANLHDGITAIGIGAFCGCRLLAGITLPPLVTRIESEAFSDCRSLTRINIHDRIQSIAHYAFAGCVSLSSVTLPDSVTYIGHKDAFPPSTVIHAAYGSFAEQYARKHYFPFEPVFPPGYAYQPAQSYHDTILAVLKKIKESQGDEAFKNPRLFKGLTSDFLPGSGKNAGCRNILCAAVEQLNIFDALQQAKLNGDAITASRLTAALVDLGYQEGLAKDAVDCFRVMVG